MKSVAPYLIVYGPDIPMDEAVSEGQTSIEVAWSEQDFRKKFSDLNDSRALGGTVFVAYKWNDREQRYIQI